MSLFLDRSRRAGPLLEWKVRILTVGGVLGVGGIYFDERWITGLAILVLLSGMLLGLLPSAGSAAEEDEDDADDDVGPGEGRPGAVTKRVRHIP